VRNRLVKFATRALFLSFLLECCWGQQLREITYHKPEEAKALTDKAINKKEALWMRGTLAELGYH
jgi:hypothetical protein